MSPAFGRRSLIVAAGGLTATTLVGCRTEGKAPTSGQNTLPVPKTIAKDIPGVIKPADPSGTLGMEVYPAPYTSTTGVPGKGGKVVTQRILYGSPPEMGSGTNPMLQNLNELTGVDWQVTNIPAAALNDKITNVDVWSSASLLEVAPGTLELQLPGRTHRWTLHGFTAHPGAERWQDPPAQVAAHTLDR